MRRKCSIVSTSSWACDEVLLCPWGWCLGDFLNHTAYHSSHSSGDGRDDWTDRRWAARYENSEPEKSATQTLETMWFTRSALAQRTTGKFTSGIDHSSKRQGGPLSHRCLTIRFIPALTDRNVASHGLIGTTTESSTNDKAKQHRFQRKAPLTIL